MGSLDTCLTDLASTLEIFFRGLSECGLLSNYSVQLQAAVVDFEVQAKFRDIICQCVRNLQNLLEKVLHIPGQDLAIDVGTQTSQILISTPPLHLEKICEAPSEPLQVQSVAKSETDAVNSFCITEEKEPSLNGEKNATITTVSLKDSEFLKSHLISETSSRGDIIVTCDTNAFVAITQASLPTSAGAETIEAYAVSGPEFLDITEIQEGKHDKIYSSKKEDISEINNGKTASVSTAPVKSMLTIPDELTVPLLETYSNVISKNGKFSVDATPNVMHIVLTAQEEKSDSVYRLIEEKNCEDETTRISKDHKLKKDTDVDVNLLSSESQNSNVDEPSEVKFESENSVFICEICDKVLYSSQSLKGHLSKKHSNYYHCDFCHKVFATAICLKEHCKMSHGGVGCLKCPKCGKRFLSKLSYKRHLDTHNSRKGAVCDICGKTFAREDYLPKHYMIHSGRKPFTCEYCNRKFLSTSNLKNHRMIHTGEKGHVCDMCGKAFGRADKLKDHVLRHLKIKRFQCSICKKDYAERRDLKKHVKQHI